NFLDLAFEWTRGDVVADSLTGLTSFNPTVTPFVTTTYEIQVEDKDGCRAEDRMVVNVSIDRPVFIPNAFSPNGDQFNQYFSIYASTDIVEEVEAFMVFDRWGEVVYERRAFQPLLTDDPDGWNGTFKGELLNPAVFVYYAKIRFVDGLTRIYKGDVTLMSTTNE
ncbi:MAG: gliding motility-associated C-terminal domain-containing protein, partial [Bacteroidota bacterium]